jgi:peptide/nickel transport system permease protein
VKVVATKTLAAAGTLVFVLVFNFFLFRVAGNPIALLVRDNPHATPAEIQRVIALRGLNRNYVTQFVIYVRQTLSGNLGTSFETGQPVSSMIAVALPNTLILVGSATFLATVIGCWLGVYAAAHRSTRKDTAVVQGSLFFYAMPDFWLGMILIFLFAVALKIFPSGGYESILATGSTGSRILDVTQHALLPVTTLTLGILGQYVVIMRASVAEVLQEDFITTARAIGLPGHRVLNRATRNAILPFVALSAINFGYVLSGAVVVETLFSWPGMGLLTDNAVNNLDYPTLQGVFLVASAAVIVCNLLADLAYAYLDPRVRTR